MAKYCDPDALCEGVCAAFDVSTARASGGGDDTILSSAVVSVAFCMSATYAPDVMVSIACDAPDVDCRSSST